MKNENVELIKHAAQGREDLDGKVILALIAERETVIEILRACEWLGRATEDDGDGNLYVEDQCPACRHLNTEGHASDCRLAALIRP